MKNKFLQFAIAFFTPILITLPTFYFLREIAFFSFISLFIHIILTVWLSFKLSHIFAKIILWIMSVLGLFLLILFFIVSLDTYLPIVSIETVTKIKYKDVQSSNYTENAIMMSNKLTLYEKFVNISFSSFILLSLVAALAPPATPPTIKIFICFTPL